MMTYIYIYIHTHTHTYYLEISISYAIFKVSPWCLSGKKNACQCRRQSFNPWVRKIPWSRQWQPTPVFLPGKSYGQRSLAGYRPWGRRVRLDLATEHAGAHATFQQAMQTVKAWVTLLTCGKS